ncbi:stage V sporulation protein AD [Alkalihalobacillus sp. LMS39]|uniref:stage V sporulation protein AD n=1 Tax=Alkalihalobacillus sp. LMS39 TaxID=2924032 RepID=UPI001FB34F3C|nr:stage V sporulation protein AD [Alkalihalobacillus sp. LMS39]UOE92445.1 stage V sporulation protein AD [Alkalihalobacillus sp. LMS39]
MKRKGKQTWVFENGAYIKTSGTAVGPLEAEGPLQESFDKIYDNLYCGEENWELAERRLLTDAIEQCLKKDNKKQKDIDFFIAGDLLNQNVTSNYVARTEKIPFLGVFSACATAMETVALSALLVDGGYADYVMAATSSHNATAERQFRFPTEFGGQKPNTSTFTVTGAGAALVSKDKSSIRIREATIGTVVDLGVKDPFNMGTAMAPAAYETIVRHFEDTKRDVSDYDLIVTGDLSRIGSGILKTLLLEKKIDIAGKYDDCGTIIYSPDQPVFAGGSGCACPAVVTFGHLFQEMKKGKINRMLVVATGALLSPTMMQQKESIPCIAHGVVFEYEGEQL